MNRATNLRTKVYTAISTIEVDEVLIPVFYENVNPNIDLPSVGGASEVYILMQSAQVNMNEVQPYCAPRFNLGLQFKAATIFDSVGSANLSETIAQSIYDKLTDDRAGSKIADISKIELISSSNMVEESSTQIAYSYILTLNFIQNG